MRQLGTRDEAPVALTPIDIAWIEQRVAVTLASNDIVHTIDNGFLTISGPSGTSEPISLAPLGAQLTKIERSQWSGYTWEWCVQTLASPAHIAIGGSSATTPDSADAATAAMASKLDIEAQIEDLMKPVAAPARSEPMPVQPAPDGRDHTADLTLAEILATSQASTLPTGSPEPASPVLASPMFANPMPANPVFASSVFDVELALQHTLDELDAGAEPAAPTIDIDIDINHVSTTPPSLVAAPKEIATTPLESVISELSVRLVSEAMAKTMPITSLVETSVPNMYAALSSGAGQWVTPSDLEAWGITRDMALEMAEARVVALSPEVTIVFLDDSTPVYVMETIDPDVASLLPYIDSHVPIADGAEVTVALANDHTMFVHVAPGENQTHCLQLLIDAAGAEYAQQPGMANPALFSWSSGGELTPLVVGLQTAAGRLSARALVGATA